MLCIIFTWAEQVPSTRGFSTLSHFLAVQRHKGSNEVLSNESSSQQ